MSPDDGVTAWPCSTKNSSKTFRRWLASTNPGPLLIRTRLPAARRWTSRFETLAQALLRLPHAFAALGHRRPKIGAELLEGRAEVGRDPLGAVAADRLPHEAGEPERHAEPEADA